MLEVLRQAMNMDTISAITSTIFIILIGYFARKKGLFNETVAGTLSNLVLDIALPALAFQSFMQDFDTSTLSQTAIVIIWSFVIYILLIPLVKVAYSRYKGVEKNTLETITMYGSLSFFGIPIVSAVYGNLAILYANVFQIGYRVWMYTHGSIKLDQGGEEGKGHKKEFDWRTIFLNGSIIATFLGLLVWVFQDAMPQVAVATPEGIQHYGFLRIDQTAPWLYKPMNYLASLCSPLAWLSIGATLGETNLAAALKDKTSWYYSFIKTMIVPLLNLVVMIILRQFIPIDTEAIAATTILMATPTAAAIAAMAIAQGPEEARITSWGSSISIVAASLIALPIWIIIIYALQISGLI